MYVPQNTFGCCPLTNDPKQPGIRPIKLELQPSPEFNVRFKSGIRYKSHQAGTPIKLRGGQKVILLKLRANPNTPLGSYVIRGKLTYEPMQDEKLQSRELEVVIPVKVIADGSKIQDIDWPFGTHVKRSLVRILALPVEIPAAILLWIACSTGCDL